ncbi:hypothetical protein EYB45_07395 [Erythrobacteraceae bacterium CFH 75059]|uniref:hypothetical protein n=1 Tax=Qipengyuania thermophila TaxID=2509361 RepID=UPI00101EC24C|nr:hypothetical protein [Qipengyuania thermophila]TCD05298.1 hypothetical protein EYB45_07395 [Erythrobacteraceae bacterium CFH 75059]
MRFAICLALSVLAASGLSAQMPRKELDVAKQRAAIEAWTACIADENRESVARTLARDFTSAEYQREMTKLAQTRGSGRCFNAMPAKYRRIELGGLPFAGGLAERLLETHPDPLVLRLSRAVAGKAPATYSYTDAVAMCAVRGAPHVVAALFETPINSPEEVHALADVKPVFDICARQGGRPVEASAMGMRSMLATASFRLLQAQES